MTIDAIRKRYAANADADNPTYYCTLSSADVDALFAALDAEREKVEKALKATRRAISKCRRLPADCEAELDLEEIEQILEGGGDD